MVSSDLLVPPPPGQTWNYNSFLSDSRHDVGLARPGRHQSPRYDAAVANHTPFVFKQRYVLGDYATCSPIDISIYTWVLVPTAPCRRRSSPKSSPAHDEGKMHSVFTSLLVALPLHYTEIVSLSIGRMAWLCFSSSSEIKGLYSSSYSTHHTVHAAFPSASSGGDPLPQSLHGADALHKELMRRRRIARDVSCCRTGGRDAVCRDCWRLREIMAAFRACASSGLLYGPPGQKTLGSRAASKPASTNLALGMRFGIVCVRHARYESGAFPADFPHRDHGHGPVVVRCRRNLFWCC